MHLGTFVHMSACMYERVHMSVCMTACATMSFMARLARRCKTHKTHDHGRAARVGSALPSARSGGTPDAVAAAQPEHRDPCTGVIARLLLARATLCAMHAERVRAAVPQPEMTRCACRPGHLWTQRVWRPWLNG